MAQVSEENQVTIGVMFNPREDCYNILTHTCVTSVKREAWPEFLDWLSGRWRTESWEGFDMLHSPRLDLFVLTFTVNAGQCLFTTLIAFDQEGWGRTVEMLRNWTAKAEESFVGPYAAVRSQGLSPEEAGTRLMAANPLLAKPLWQQS